MATTHVFVGLALVAPVAYTVPELATALAVGAIIGGLAPDFDLVFTHRRTFHFPFVGGAFAVPLLAVTLLFPSALTAFLAAFALTAWVHAVSDAAGGGPEMDPWTNPTDRAVYDHVRGRWLRPRRWIRYDGAPEDAVLAVSLAVVPLFVFDGLLRTVILTLVVVSVIYALLRRRLIEWTPDWLE
ncbi:metal-dependent hydrolase [Halobacteria archaeon AArc-curdl1]|uniref:Metal-dependent hydrolase n=1 Tax=Natronosalvus hydrolyticus TaxID=2979988 RepID=A0AAP3E6G3_9EURY|nr:metal-dependent hydrolase [Halobacteria archaeon AArc-curdl1]